MRKLSGFFGALLLGCFTLGAISPATAQTYSTAKRGFPIDSYYDFEGNGLSEALVQELVPAYDIKSFKLKTLPNFRVLYTDSKGLRMVCAKLSYEIDCSQKVRGSDYTLTRSFSFFSFDERKKTLTARFSYDVKYDDGRYWSVSYRGWLRYTRQR